MKRFTYSFLLAIVALLFCKTSFAASTWYVRADGGTRYSSNAPLGQCDGLADTAYPGFGVNQHCAFNDVRFLWDDQHSYNQLQWVIAGGDTVLLDNTKQWRIGWDTADGNAEPWCWGWSGGAFGCFNPPLPAGTAAQPTRILGRNFASCNAGNQPDKTKMTQIFGGHGVGVNLNLAGAQFVDVQCIEFTRHSDCVRHGNPAYPSECNSNYPLDDYDSDGLGTDVGTHDLLLQDLWIHGHTDRGIIGPIGGLVTANRVDIDTNGMAGWDFDDGRATPLVNAVLKMNYSTIEWSGCNQEYPFVHPIPVASCYSQSTGGYGDGIGTPAGTGMSAYIDHSVFRYNTQDGEDFGHVDTGSYTLSITNSASYANNGGQFKWGGNFYNVTFQNNIAVANCLRMSEPLPGAPSTYNANLADFCRAEDAVSFDLRNGTQTLFNNNTILTYAPTTFDIQCWDSNSCANSTLTMTNNIVRGYDNPSTYNLGGQGGGPGGFCGAGCNGSTVPLGTIIRSNNLYFGLRGCPANQLSDAVKGSATNESCTDPALTNEPYSFANEATLDPLNFALTQGSPAVYTGIAVPGLTTDFDSQPRHTPTSIGALEYGSQATLVTIQTAPISITGPAPVVPVLPITPIQPMPLPLPTPTPTPSPTPQQVLTATTLAASTNKTTHIITLTATVQAKSGAAAPSGVIGLYTNGIAIAQSTLANGTATWAIAETGKTLSLTAKFSGTTSFGASSSKAVLVK